MDPWLWTLGSVALISLISLVGAVAVAWRSVARHGVMLVLVALAAGTLLGDALFHLLPEGFHTWEEQPAMLGLLAAAGFVLLFALEAGLRWHHAHGEHLDDHGHGAAHGIPAEETGALAHGQIKPFGWLNLVGDAVHNLVDGIVIAAAFVVDVRVGIATTVAVAIHEIPQELGDFAVLVRAGMKPARALLLNLGSAAFAVVGAVAVLASGLEAEAVQRYAVPLIAGAFLYIAAADLVPELHHHTRPRDLARIFLAFVAGLVLMALMMSVEPPGHSH